MTVRELNRKPGRFYKSADILPAEGGVSVALDGRAAKTPAGAPLTLATEALARLVCAEWAAVGAEIDFARMPATRLAYTAIDRTSGARAAVAESLGRAVGSDALCYFADGPAALVARQEAAWGPWLAWAERDLGLVLVRAKGVSHQVQPVETIARAETLAAALDDFALTGLAFAAGLYGSAVLAFAAERRAVSATEAFELSRLDEAFQEEQWGVDHEAALRTEGLRAEAAMLDAWFRALSEADPPNL